MSVLVGMVSGALGCLTARWGRETEEQRRRRWLPVLEPAKRDGRWVWAPVRVNAPVLVFEREGDVHVFASLRMAEQWMEAVDVVDGEYAVAYLPDGRRYLPTAEGHSVRLVPAGDADEQDLHRRLSAYRLRVPTAAGTDDPAVFAAETLRWQEERRWSARLRRLLRRSR